MVTRLSMIREGIRFSRIMPPPLLVLYFLMGMFGAAFSVECYECSYTNNTLPPGARILGMVLTKACLDLDPGKLDSNVRINTTCKLGCKSTHFVQGGMQLVLRGCLQPSADPCANYTTNTMSETCCTSHLCNHGTVGQSVPKRRQTVKCYQCVGSTSDQDKIGMNKYADKSMRISQDCMDETFNPGGKYVELNSTCESGCLTGIITDKLGIVYVNRGCASEQKFKCVSGVMSGEQTTVNRNLKSIVQKCCTTDYCNSGDSYTIVRTEPTTFQNDSDKNGKPGNKNDRKMEKSTVVGHSPRTTSCTQLLFLFTLLSYFIV